MALRYVNSKKQKPKLIDSGHRFINDKSNETAVYWKCDKSKSFKCCAHLNTDGENIIKGIGAHNHAANVAGLQVAQVVNSAKTWATSNSNGILAVFTLLPSPKRHTVDFCPSQALGAGCCAAIHYDRLRTSHN